MYRAACGTVSVLLWILILVLSGGMVAGGPEVVFGADGTVWPEVSYGRIAAGISQPTNIVNAGDRSGRVFFTEQAGRILVLKAGAVLGVPFLDIRDRVSCCGERGLLGLAFPPGYAQKGVFYLNYTNLSGDTVVARYRVTSDPDVASPESEEILLTISQPFANHNGGQLAFGPDGYLYVAAGDGGSGGDPTGNGQNPATLLGKILRIDVESETGPYAIPADNPFVNDPAARDEIWALGLRNPWRFSFDRLTGDLYIGDVGQDSYEEINFQPTSSPGGENYGWNVMEGMHCFRDLPCAVEGFTLPVAEYDHTLGVSVTGGAVYRGDVYPRMRGVYFYADLARGRLWGLRNSGGEWQNEVVSRNTFRVTTFGDDEAGNLYLADYNQGDIYVLEDSVRWHQLELVLNQDVYERGDTLTLTMINADGTSSPPGDLYVAVWAPFGAFFFFDGQAFHTAFMGGEFFPAAVKAYRENSAVTAAGETVFALRLDAPLPPGRYDFYAVLVQPGADPLATAAWLSRLAVASAVF
jgi:glucose/arabinose dehydrogenase